MAWPLSFLSIWGKRRARPARWWRPGSRPSDGVFAVPGRGPASRFAPLHGSLLRARPASSCTRCQIFLGPGRLKRAVGARVIPSTKSGFFCAPRVIGSPHVKRNASVRPSWQMRRISVLKSPTFTGQVREVFHQDTPAQGRRLAAHLIESLPRCPIPEIARLGRTLRKWKDAFLAYFDTDGASNGPTEAINGIIELGRRTARGYRTPTNYQLRMLLIAGGLDASTHTQL